MATVTDPAAQPSQDVSSAITPLYGQIAKVKLLSAEQERALAMRIERGDLAAKTHLIEANLRLVAAIAKRFTGLGLPAADLFQEGVIGLIRAAEKFDYRKGYKFSTYASLWIREAIQRGLQKKGRVVYLPADVWRTASRIRRSRTKLTQRLGREPETHEIATDVSLTDKQVKAVTQAFQGAVSLNTTVAGAEELELGETLLDANSPAPDRDGETAGVKAAVVRGLDALGGLGREVIELRFGVGDCSAACSVTETAERLRISRPKLRQIEHRALARLRGEEPIATWGPPHSGPQAAASGRSDTPQLSRVAS
jgi:RNA polymerase primary sigma factor